MDRERRANANAEKGEENRLSGRARARAHTLALPRGYYLPTFAFQLASRQARNELLLRERLETYSEARNQGSSSFSVLHAHARTRYLLAPASECTHIYMYILTYVRICTRLCVREEVKLAHGWGRRVCVRGVNSCMLAKYSSPGTIEVLDWKSIPIWATYARSLESPQRQHTWHVAFATRTHIL